MRRFICLLFTAAALSAANGQTLDECQQAAERNYPLIQRMDLIRQTTDLTVDNIQKGWLPQVTGTAQATYQSDVTAFPEQLQGVYQQMGINMKGLRKDQYRIGVTTQSESTIHRIMHRELSQSDFERPISHPYLYHLNLLIKKYKETKDKELFFQLKNDLPEGFLQRRIWQHVP